MGSKTSFGPAAGAPREPSTVTAGVGGSQLDAAFHPGVVDPCCGGGEALAELEQSMLDLSDSTVASIAAVSSEVATQGQEFDARLARVARLPYLSAPANPHAWDLDAAAMTDPDLAANGWTVQLLNAPFTVLTRAGDVDFTNSAAVGTYRSTLRNGALVFQGPGAAVVQIHKAWPAGFATLRAHATPSHLVSTAAHQVCAWLANGERYREDTVTSRIYYVVIDQINLTEVEYAGSETWNVFENFNVTFEAAASAIIYMHHSAAGQYSAQAVDEHGRSIKHRFTPFRTLSMPTPSHAGIWLRNGTNHWSHIHSIRRRPLYEMP